MELSKGLNLLIERPSPHLWVIRMTRPDPRVELDGAGVEDCPLYKDLDSSVLRYLQSSDVLILNFGLVHFFPTAYYQVLLQLRELLAQRNVRMILCSFTPEVQESIRLFRGDRVFEIVSNEDQAIHRSTQPVGGSRF